MLFWLSLLSLAAAPSIVLPSDPAFSGGVERAQTLLAALSKHNPPSDPCVVLRHEQSSGRLETVLWLRDRRTHDTTTTLTATLRHSGDIWVDGVLHTWHPSGEPASERVVNLQDGRQRESITWRRDASGRVLEQQRVLDDGFEVQHWHERNRYRRDGRIKRRLVRIDAGDRVTRERIRLRWKEQAPVSRRSRWTQTGSPTDRCRSVFTPLEHGWVETRSCRQDPVPLVRTVQHNERGQLLLEETVQMAADWTARTSKRWTWSDDHPLTLHTYRPMLGEVHTDYTWQEDRLIRVVEQGQSHRVVWLWGEGCPARPLPEPSLDP